MLTFEPHPRITLGQDEGLKLLNTLEEKAILLESCGVDYMLVIPFDKAFSRLSHQEFITDYIVGRLGVKELIVGYNHRFGHNKGGNYAYLVERGAGLHVTEVAQHLVDEHKVSSTVIRNTIERGEMALAEELTGHPYIIIGNADSSGIVTTNPYKLLPPCGEYSATINGSNHMVHIKEGSVEVGEEFASQRVVIEL